MAAYAHPSDRRIAPRSIAPRTLLLLADRGIRLCCAVWLGIMAGFFYAFSVLVMPGLADAGPAAAIPAMRGINDAVGNPLFGLGFFGVLPLCLLTIVLAALRRDLAGWLAGIGAATYLLGVFVVTVALNIPLNDELDGRTPDRTADLDRMAGWISEWSTWNDLRTVAATAAFVLVAASLVPGIDRRRSGTRVVGGRGGATA